MIKFIFLVGLPGSGKTYYGKSMDGLFLDDISCTCGTKRLKETFDVNVVIVADPSLCRPVNRTCAGAMVKKYHPDCEIEWIYFSNNPEKCWKNVSLRDDGRKISRHSIFDLSKNYKIPENAKVIDVWSFP